jgi:hypothetical protein
MWPFKKKEDDHDQHAHMPKIGRWHLDAKVLGEGVPRAARRATRASRRRCARPWPPR